MTAREVAADILRRCWWRADKHPGETPPEFKGLDVEIEEAILAERRRCAEAARARMNRTASLAWASDGIAAEILKGD